MTLKAVALNCTLNQSPARSHTQALLDRVLRHLVDWEVETETIRVVDHNVPPGIESDLGDGDDWPMILDRLKAADIIIIGTPIWFGVRSSVAQRVIERLDGTYREIDEASGQFPLYGKVGAVVVTGNEDGVKHAAMTLIYAMGHLGYTIPPQADCGWIGEAGPGPSYGDELPDGSRAGFGNDFTQRNTTIMTWNLMHLAKLLAGAGGYSNHGNDRNAWKAGCRFDFANPEHRA